MLQKVCVQHKIGVILVAHHADDQVEFLISSIHFQFKFLPY